MDNAGNEPYDGPRDLYYDRPTRSLFFTGDNGESSESHPEPPECIGRYSFADRKLKIWNTTLDMPLEICTHTRPDGKTRVYFTWGNWWTASPSPPTFLREFTWPNVSKIKDLACGGECVRISPDGKVLSWIGGTNPYYTLVLYDLKTKTRRVVAKWYSCWSWESRGCPYSWSPTGRSIAYSDGSQIYIVSADMTKAKAQP